MPTAEARIPTGQPSRYLIQICRHGASHGTLDLGWGRCTMQAGPGTLTALGVAMCWLMAFIGVALGSPESVQVTGFRLIMPLTFASSVLVPAASMPGWLQSFVRINPITIFSDAMRGLILGGPVAVPVLQAAARNQA